MLNNIVSAMEGHPRPDFRMTTAAGRCVWMRPQATVFEENGHRYVQGILLDVTAAEDAGAEHERLGAQLRHAQKLEAVGQLAAGIANEINTPIQFVDRHSGTITFTSQPGAGTTFTIHLPIHGDHRQTDQATAAVR